MKRIITFFLCLTISLLFVLTAGAKAPVVSDSTENLTDKQIASLTDKAEKIGQKHGVDIVILLENEYVSDPKSYAEEYYDYNGYGDDGIIFYLSLYSRDWHMATSDECIDTLSEYRLNLVFDEISGYLAEDDFYNAFDLFLDQCDKYLERDTNQNFGEFVDDVLNDYENETESFGEIVVGGILGLVIVIPIAFVLAWIIVSIEKRKMNNAVLQKNANMYIIKGSLDIEKEQEIYVNTTVSRVPINTGSNSHVGSRSGGGDGRSHGGTGGKF